MPKRTAITVPKAALVGLVILIALGAAVAVAFFVLPSARIVVTPKLQEKQAEQAITLSAGTDVPDFKKFVLPARVVESLGEAQKVIKRTGGTARSDRARGTVRLLNKQDEEQPLLPQTNLRHEETGVFFLTDTAVRIPVQGELTVAVTAKEEGAMGNVPAGKFVVDKLPASLQPYVWAESDIAFTGGEVFDTPLTEVEITTAQDDVVRQARDRARGELTGQAGGAVIREDLIAESIEEKATSATAGSQATSYTVSARVRLRAFIVDDTATLSLTLLALQAQAGPNEEFASYRPESFSVDFERADFERGEARITGRLTGSFAEKIESKIFDARTLAGRTSAEVEEYFKQFSSVEGVHVTLSPFWVTTVPSRAEAVEVVVEKK